MKVVIHHTDGVNPYAAEVASLLTRRGAGVTVVDARNGEHRPPPGVRWMRRLPANFGGGSLAHQLMWLLAGVITTLWASVVRRHLVVVTSTRFPLEDLAFAGLAVLRRPVVVVLHNPRPRVAESAVRARSQRVLVRRATAVIVHAERLRADVDAGAASRVRVCPHPPYVHSTPPVRVDEEEHGEDGRRWLAYIGTLRWDKGSDVLAEIFSLVPAAERQRLGLIVCGRGALPEGDWERLAGLGVRTRDLTSPYPIPQAQLLAVLAEQPLVLAPYVAATQSGTVILALTMGCRVLAFDQGGIPDVLSPEGLVPTGDLQAFADAIAEGRGGRGTLTLEEWEQHAGDAWWSAVQAVSV